MKKRYRIRHRSDFQRLLAGHRVYSAPSLVAFAAPGRSPHTRVGVTTSRQIRGAVARNRARRRLREAARLSLFGDGSIGSAPGITFDVVLIARPAALTAALSSLQGELRSFGDRLAAGLNP